MGGERLFGAYMLGALAKLGAIIVSSKSQSPLALPANQRLNPILQNITLLQRFIILQSYFTIS